MRLVMETYMLRAVERGHRRNSVCGTWRTATFVGCEAAPWALSRQRRNRLKHAENGNVRGGRRGDGKEPQVKLSPRELQEVQLAAKLRAAGWKLPPEVDADTPMTHACRTST